ncbi:MAG TPA: tRNA lysidine(34) synthetase TilS [Pyrinomonadaceae bacterium]|nr:tRNA lysidine(34) synthetase TilS [Pyrinomonadaceae bacterium]
MKKSDLMQVAPDAASKQPLSSFARRLAQAWRRLALPRDGRVVVAVSGGADSTALLLAFDELNRAGRTALTLKVAHLDHGLRGEAGACDARFVAELARSLGYEVETGKASVGQRAQATRDNLEQAARRERYEFLGGAARAWKACAVATAHTVEDQAETLLLALLRGSGARGLGGMRPVRPFDERGDELLLVRPLLGWARRAQTVEYCAERGVGVRSDEMNTDERFARVRVRRQLLPLLETFNPRAVETLARTASLLRAEADTLENLGEQLLAEARRAGRLKAEALRVKDGAGRRRCSGAAENNGLAVEIDAAEAGHDADAAADAAVIVAADAAVVAADAAGVVAADAAGVVAEDSAVEECVPLSVEVLLEADRAVLGYALRGWLRSKRGDLRRIEATHIEAVAGLLEGARGGRVAELPGGGRVLRRRGLLLFRAGGRRAGKS